MAHFRSPSVIGRLVLGAVLALSLSSEVFARAGAGGSIGSRGTRSWSAPAPTNTAPRTAAPIDRPTVAPAQPAPNQGLLRPAPTASGGWFGGALGRGLLGGLIGAGLFGLLSGHGLFGGLGDIMSFLGLIVQVGLVVLIVRFAINYFRRPKIAMAGVGGSGPGAMPMGAASAPAQAKLAIGPNDFSIFEQRLNEVQTAYGAEDINRLRTFATPEMAASLADEIDQNARKGVINRIGGVKLLQGDLSESWREAAGEFASVAMRYGLIDATYERASNRLVAGNDNVPQEATEVWTFHRPTGGSAAAWKLSAIQQS